MLEIKYYIILFLQYFKMNFFRKLEYKKDFFIDTIGNLLNLIISIVFLQLVFNNITNIEGWTIYEMTFILGIATITKAIYSMFFGSLLVLRFMFREGSFKMYMIRPANSLFLVISSLFTFDKIGDFIFGLIITFISANHLRVDITFQNVGTLMIFIIIGSCIAGSLALMCQTITFYNDYTFSPIYIVESFLAFSNYPITIFISQIKNILTFVIPFGFIGFYPANYFLNKVNVGFNPIIVGSIIMVVLVSIALITFNQGLKKYDAIG